ncbi:hypothetical protein K2Y11_24305 [bacterium]|nr:hypothetical protein [bacterium]
MLDNPWETLGAAERLELWLLPAFVELLDDSDDIISISAALFVIKGREFHPDHVTMDVLQKAESIVTTALSSCEVELQIMVCSLLYACCITDSIKQYLLQLRQPDNDLNVRIMAISVLLQGSSVSAADIQVLVKALGESMVEDVSVLFASITLLRKGLRLELVLPLLEKIIADRPPAVVFHIINQLGLAGPIANPLVPSLHRLIKGRQTHSIVRFASLRAIGGIDGSSQATGSLLFEFVSSTDTASILGAIKGMHNAGIRGREMVDVLLRQLKAPERELRSAAAVALRDFSEDAEMIVPHLLDQAASEPDQQLLIEIALTFSSMGEVAARAAIERLRTGDVRHCASIGGMFALQGDVGLKMLVEALSTEEEYENQGAMIALLWPFGPKAAVAVPTLISILNDVDDMDIASGVLRAIRIIGPEAVSAADAVIDFLEDHDGRFLELGESILAAMGHRVVEIIRDRMSTVNPAVREVLQRVLIHEERLFLGEPSRFQAIRTEWLERFVQIADLLESNGPMSWSDVAAAMAKESRGQSEGVGERNLPITMKSLAKEFGDIPLTFMKKKGKNLLSHHGRAMSMQVKKYLTQRQHND